MFKKILAQPILRIWFFFELIGLLLMIAAHLIAGRYATLTVFIFLVFLNVLVLFFSKPRIYKLFAHQRIEGEDAWRLTAKAKKFAALAEIPVPEIYLLETDGAFSFSFSNSPVSSAIFLSETLVEDLAPQELEAIIAFEVARIALGQNFMAVIASSFGCILNMFADFFDKFILLQAFASREKRKHYVEDALAPLVMALAYGLIHKSQNLDADKLACQWLGDRKTLAVTLWKLDSLVATRPSGYPHRLRLSDSYLFSINPLTNETWTRYFLLQASVKKRIINLVGHYPV